MDKISMSHEDYLEAIVMLGGTTERSVRSVDVANRLGVSKASVNKAVGVLKERGLVEQPYGNRCVTTRLHAGVEKSLCVWRVDQNEVIVALPPHIGCGAVFVNVNDPLLLKVSAYGWKLAADGNLDLPQLFVFLRSSSHISFDALLSWVLPHFSSWLY